MTGSTAYGLTFLYLGMAVLGNQVWHTGTVLYTVLYRVVRYYVSLDTVGWVDYMYKFYWRIFANVQIVLLSVICLKILLQGSGTLCILKKQEIHGDVAKKHCLAKLLFHGLNPTCAGFVVWTLVLCFVFRFLITFTLTFLVNWLRKGIKPINWQVCLSNYYVINNLLDFFIFKTTVIFQYV